MIRNIQVLRALAVYLVVMEHALPLFVLGGIKAGPWSFGHAGVDIFFVISGFIMVITTDTRETRPRDFALHRIVRIVPLYWVITFAVFAVAIVAPKLLQATRANPLDLIKSLLFIPFAKSNGLIEPVVFVGWTLNYEMFFYLLFTLSLFLRNRTVRIALLIASLVILTVAGVGFAGASAGWRFYTDAIMLEFGAGMLLGAAWSKLPQGKIWIVAAVCGLVVGGVLIALRPTLWLHVHRAVAFGIPAFLMVGGALILERAGRVVRAGWILLLGNASYSMYLTHFFVTQASNMLGKRVHLHGVLPALAVVALTFVLVAVVGIAVHWYVELPLTRRVKGMVFPKVPSTVGPLNA